VLQSLPGARLVFFRGLTGDHSCFKMYGMLLWVSSGVYMAVLVVINPAMLFA